MKFVMFPSYIMVKIMVSYEQAKQLAIEYINSHDKFTLNEFPGNGLVLEHSSEFDKGWIFYFNSKLFLETHNVKHRLLGLGTIIVGKESGEIYEVDSGGNEELIIRRFNELLINRHLDDEQV